MNSRSASLFSDSRFWLFAAAAVVGGMVATLWLWFWLGGIPSGTTSGVWTALAADCADGIFYRPLHDATGHYGGTRYLPLFFLLQAGWLKAGGDVVTSGWVLMVGSVLLFDAALYRLLRQGGVARAAALAWTVLAHASLSYQLVTLEVRADVLAAAGSLWGWWWAQRNVGRMSVAAVGCFVAAFACKLTAAAGLVAVLAWVVSRREYRLAAWYAAATGLLMAGVLLVTNLASEGRAWAALRACAAGGDTPGYALKAPMWFFLTLGQDPFLLVLVVGAVGVAWQQRAAASGAAYFLGAAAVTTLPLFASPGTGANHLLEWLAAAVVVLGTAWQQAPARPVWRGLLGIILAGCLVMLLTPVPTLRSFIEERGRPTRAGVARIAERLAGDARPVLSENPLLPLLMGQRPVVLDAFALRVVGQRQPAVTEDFNRRLQRQEFSAVILLDWSGAPEAELPTAVAAHGAFGVEAFYGGVHFPVGFIERLNASYEYGFVERPYVIFLPKGGRHARAL